MHTRVPIQTKFAGVSAWLQHQLASQPTCTHLPFALVNNLCYITAELISYAHNVGFSACICYQLNQVTSESDRDCYLSQQVIRASDADPDLTLVAI